MKGTLKITLKSDLCVGVGKHFAAVIDLDTALDEYGLPYIPSRRLKGCMREIADEIFDAKNTDSIFGIAGNDIPGTLTITDAKIKDYNQIVEVIKNNTLISTNEITELFCSVRSETGIENDTVKDKSLRFIRVVNQYSPFEKCEQLHFFANVEFDDSDYDTIQKVCKALHNIGYHRNRGFGAVKCELLPESQCDNEFEIKKPEAGLEEDKWYELRYSVYLDDDMMLPATDANHSLDYIPGTSVMGALASKYVKIKGAEFNKKEFNEIFISNGVRFGNLYITDENGSNYFPVPRFLAKIKAATADSDKGVKNLITVNVKQEENQKDNTADTEKTKTYKPLKNGYINKDQELKEPKTKIVYHNATGENGIGLYMQYCLCSGQYFKGAIQAKGEIMNVLCSLVDRNISFGRSKTAQYSHCTVLDGAEVIPIIDDISTVDLDEGEIAAYVLESDVIITADNGVVTTELNNLCRLLDIDVADLRVETCIASRIISGYNAKWNMKKPQFPAIRAGSAIVFKVSKGKKGLKKYIYIGEKQNEGFGRVRLINDVKAIGTKSEDYLKMTDSTEKNKCRKMPDDDSVEINENAKRLIDKINERKLDDEIIAKAIDNSEKLELNASQIGRVTLMCKESEQIDDFIKRVESIKSDKVRENVKNSFAENILEEIFSEFSTAIDNITPEYLWGKYKKYILTTLVVKKYKLRGEDK